MLKCTLSFFIFILVFISHVLYFKIVNFGYISKNAEWLTAYLRLQEYYLGFSYAISLAFAVFAFMKFKEYKKRAIGIGLGASAWVVGLWILGCFLVGCCGSPMWLVYVNLLGISVLAVPKWSMAIISLLIVLSGYIWLIRKSPKGCCNGKPCR